MTFSLLIQKSFLAFFLLIVGLSSTAWGAPGILQTATRDGFFSNQFPDTLITLTHAYFYSADEFADSNGNKSDIDEVKVGLGLVRFIKPWHFGDHNQFQYILEGIVGQKDVSIEDTDVNMSGITDPMIYTSMGWNNPQKTTHLQAALIAVFPFGDDELNGGDSYQLMPIIAFQQQFGSFWVDGSMGYYHFFDDLSSKLTSGRDYFEINMVPSYHVGAWSFYLQGDYTITQESKLHGLNQNDDGYNFAMAGGVSWMFNSNMQLNLKYVKDIDGENELQGQGFNLRWLWIF